MFYSAAMWGDGSTHPGKDPFARQFEPDGDGYLYRRRLQGRGIRVSRTEYAAFVHQHGTRYLQHFAVIVAVSLVIAGGIILGEIAMAGARKHIVWPLMMIIVPGLFCILQWRMNAQSVAKALAGRELVGRNRSAGEARTLRMALSGWSPIGICIGLSLIVALILLVDARFSSAWDVIWLIALAIMVMAGLLTWGLLKARAIKAYRSAGGLPVRSLPIGRSRDGVTRAAQ